CHHIRLAALLGGRRRYIFTSEARNTGHAILIVEVPKAQLFQPEAPSDPTLDAATETSSYSAKSIAARGGGLAERCSFGVARSSFWALERAPERCLVCDERSG